MTQMIRCFTVQADAETGEWLPGTLQEVAPMLAADAQGRKDTADVHYDSAPAHVVGLSDGEPDVAVEVRFGAAA